MSPPLRTVSLVDAEDARFQVNSLIGVDESGNESHAGEGGDGFCVVVAVRAARTAEVDIVRAMVNNDLQPFKYKSNTLAKEEQLSDRERARRVDGFLSELDALPVGWAGIVCRDDYQIEVRAAAAVTAAKRTITRCDPWLETDAAILHDGRVLVDRYKDAVRQKVGKEFDHDFREAFNAVRIAFLNEADLTYPQSIAADYIAGYCRQQLLTGTPVSELGAHVDDYDDSWTHAGETMAPLYYLDPFEPVAGERVRSRVLAWMQGEAIPMDPEPIDSDRYSQIIERVDDDVVYRYLSEL